MPESPATPPVRPERFLAAPVPPIPIVDPGEADQASVEYSHYRTALSGHRTGLSEHRTDLSEYRSDLSTERTEMSMRRTGMSFQRTRMSGDRTLMSVIRTSLSLIGFGFTIFQAFKKLHEAGVIHSAAAPRNFGLALILLGVVLLIGGILQNLRFGRELRQNRAAMTQGGLIHGESGFPVSVTMVVAIALLVVGVLSVIGTAFDLSSLG